MVRAHYIPPAVSSDTVVPSGPIVPPLEFEELPPIEEPQLMDDTGEPPASDENETTIDATEPKSADPLP